METTNIADSYDIVFNKKDLLESLCHAVLILNKKLKIATKAADKELRELLIRYGSFHEILKEKYGLMNNEVLSDKKYGTICEKLQKLPATFRTITVNDSDFPPHLKSIPYSTPVLYAIGDPSLLFRKSIGVVGTRQLEKIEDIEAGNKCISRLLAKDYVIVSGLALGCDTLGHRYAIEHNGKTIAVLGTTLDKHYPKENYNLQEKIAKEHLIVSQYPVGIQTFGSFFAHRNITTVGLSKEGLVVILSPDKSGTIHAIRECIDTGKQLYVLAHNLNRGFDWVKEYQGKYKVVKDEEKAILNS